MSSDHPYKPFSSDDLEVTSVLDPDFQNKNMDLTEQDLDDALIDPETDLSDFDFELDQVVLEANGKPEMSESDILDIDDLDVDDLDFSLLDDEPEESPTLPQAAPEPSSEKDLDFILDDAVATPAQEPEEDIDFVLEQTAAEEEDLDFTLDEPAPQEVQPPEPYLADGMDTDLAPDLGAGLEAGLEAEAEDLDFTLDEPAPQEVQPPEPYLADGMDTDLAPDLAPDLGAGLEAAVEAEDLDFTLDEPAPQEVQPPEPYLADGMDTDLGTAPDPFDRLTDQQAQESTASQVIETAFSDFDLDKFLDTEETPLEESFDQGEDDAVDTDLDFELEEVVAAPPEPAEAEAREGIDLAPPLDDFPAPEQSPAEQSLPKEPPTTMSVPAPQADTQAPMDGAEPGDDRTAGDAGREQSTTPLSDENMDRLEALVEKAVRETVSQVLERILPRIIDEVVTRELEKIRDELE
jgi:hypothetical protein